MYAAHANIPVDPQAEAHLAAYNTAFEELGLNWSWDAATYARLTGGT